MLPPRLSNGICCLKPDADRLVFSVIMEVDGGGQVVRKRFTEAVIRSRARMTYTSVARILRDRDREERGRYAGLVPLFETMEELCLILAKKRYRRGAVDFDLPEAEIEIGSERACDQHRSRPNATSRTGSSRNSCCWPTRPSPGS